MSSFLLSLVYYMRVMKRVRFTACAEAGCLLSLRAGGEAGRRFAAPAGGETALRSSHIGCEAETNAMQPRFRSASSRFGLRPILFKDISLPHASMGCLLSLRAGGEAGRRFAAPAGGETALRSSHIGCEAETNAMQPRFRSASSRFGLRPILFKDISLPHASMGCLLSLKSAWL